MILKIFVLQIFLISFLADFSFALAPQTTMDLDTPEQSGSSYSNRESSARRDRKEPIYAEIKKNPIDAKMKQKLKKNPIDDPFREDQESSPEVPSRNYLEETSEESSKNNSENDSAIPLSEKFFGILMVVVVVIVLVLMSVPMALFQQGVVMSNFTLPAILAVSFSIFSVPIAFLLYKIATIFPSRVSSTMLLLMNAGILTVAGLLLAEQIIIPSALGILPHTMIFVVVIPLFVLSFILFGIIVKKVFFSNKRIFYIEKSNKEKNESVEDEQRVQAMMEFEEQGVDQDDKLSNNENFSFKTPRVDSGEYAEIDEQPSASNSSIGNVSFNDKERRGGASRQFFSSTGNTISNRDQSERNEREKANSNPLIDFDLLNLKELTTHTSFTSLNEGEDISALEGTSFIENLGLPEAAQGQDISAWMEENRNVQSNEEYRLSDSEANTNIVATDALLKVYNSDEENTSFIESRDLPEAARDQDKGMSMPKSIMASNEPLGDSNSASASKTTSLDYKKDLAFFSSVPSLKPNLKDEQKVVEINPTEMAAFVRDKENVPSSSNDFIEKSYNALKPSMSDSRRVDSPSKDSIEKSYNALKPSMSDSRRVDSPSKDSIEKSYNALKPSMSDSRRVDSPSKDSIEKSYNALKPSMSDSRRVDSPSKDSIEKSDNVLKPSMSDSRRFDSSSSSNVLQWLNDKNNEFTNSQEGLDEPLNIDEYADMETDTQFDNGANWEREEIPDDMQSYDDLNFKEELDKHKSDRNFPKRRVKSYSNLSEVEAKDTEGWKPYSLMKEWEFEKDDLMKEWEFEEDFKLKRLSVRDTDVEDKKDQGDNDSQNHEGSLSDGFSDSPLFPEPITQNDNLLDFDEQDIESILYDNNEYSKFNKNTKDFYYLNSDIEYDDLVVEDSKVESKIEEDRLSERNDHSTVERDNTVVKTRSNESIQVENRIGDTEGTTSSSTLGKPESIVSRYDVSKVLSFKNEKDQEARLNREQTDSSTEEEFDGRSTVASPTYVSELKAEEGGAQVVSEESGGPEEKKVFDRSSQLATELLLRKIDKLENLPKADGLNVRVGDGTVSSENKGDINTLILLDLCKDILNKLDNAFSSKEQLTDVLLNSYKALLKFVFFHILPIVEDADEKNNISKKTLELYHSFFGKDLSKELEKSDSLFEDNVSRTKDILNGLYQLIDRKLIKMNYTDIKILRSSLMEKEEYKTALNNFKNNKAVNNIKELKIDSVDQTAPIVKILFRFWEIVQLRMVESGITDSDKIFHEAFKSVCFSCLEQSTPNVLVKLFKYFWNVTAKKTLKPFQSDICSFDLVNDLERYKFNGSEVKMPPKDKAIRKDFDNIKRLRKLISPADQTAVDEHFPIDSLMDQTRFPVDNELVRHFTNIHRTNILTDPSNSQIKELWERTFDEARDKVLQMDINQQASDRGNFLTEEDRKSLILLFAFKEMHDFLRVVSKIIGQEEFGRRNIFKLIWMNLFDGKIENYMSKESLRQLFFITTTSVFEEVKQFSWAFDFTLIEDDLNSFKGELTNQIAADLLSSPTDFFEAVDKDNRWLSDISQSA
ncbi:hypothetical protein AB834_04000 [PVC group bacterium (ex Bugula neritina AB1)]|nr:hypothetical protein AB834_04000 [PVC group bacterium (ex Bugula neritina AB1)]